MLKIVLSNSAGIPIYEQIREQIKAAILGGDVVEGEILPSIRQLARDLKISVITTTRAYSDLEQEGFITNVQGKGCYVLPIHTEMVKEQLMRQIEEDLASAIKNAKLAKLPKAEFTTMLDLLSKEEQYE